LERRKTLSRGQTGDLSNVRLLQNLSDEAIRFLEQRSTWRSFDAGE
tara:strand:+ start:66 stop:203 length:138 start_codon:yes stop_codon:yes gene_type:complete